MLPITLYKLRKDGSYQVWTVEVRELPNGTCTICTTHGIEDMKQQVDIIEVAAGKNIGKSNETTVLEQAEAEAKSKAEDKINGGYAPTKMRSALLPMLAHTYEDRIDSVFKRLNADPQLASQTEYQFVLQPKFDGIRGLCDLSVPKKQMLTRRGKTVTQLIPHIMEELISIKALQGLVLDGEIYSYDPNYNIQSIAGAMNCNDFDTDRHGRLCYVVYDCYDPLHPELDYRDRFYAIHDTLQRLQSDSKIFNVCPVAMVYLTVATVEELTIKTQEYAAKFVTAGYEGAMVRSVYFPYTLNQRTIGLLKYKTMQDAEFEIVNIITPMTGRDKGTAIFVCKTASGDIFNAPATGTLEQRKKLYNERLGLIGKMVTVQYQNITTSTDPLNESGVPRFPKALVVRDYEEPAAQVQGNEI